MSALGVIDIGSGSVRGIVHDDDGTVRRSPSTITQLGRGLDKTGRLDPDAIAATIAAIEALRAAHSDVDEWHAIATAASREASNGAELLDRVREILGRAPRILTGEEEAAFAFRGATAGLRLGADLRILLLDIGGSSTEFVVGQGQPEKAMSVKLGALRLTERELDSDPPAPEELTNALGHVSDHVDDVLLAFGDLGPIDDVIGVGGTFSTMAAVEIGLQTFDRDQVNGFELTRDAAEDVFRTLATESLADRVHNPGLSAERAPFIVGGCCIVVGVMRRLGLPSVTVSTGNVLDGYAAHLLEPRS